MTITIDWHALLTGLGIATLDYGTHISAAQARQWACDAKIIPVVMGGKSEPLDVGRAMRTVPLSIRRALVARDRGYVFPGCDRPPGMCQAHHRRHWINGDETTADNKTLARCTQSSPRVSATIRDPSTVRRPPDTSGVVSRCSPPRTESDGLFVLSCAQGGQ